jgi:hypothetical protein
LAEDAFTFTEAAGGGSARGNRNAGPVGNPLAIILVVVLIIVFVVWRLVLLLR